MTRQDQLGTKMILKGHYPYTLGSWREEVGLDFGSKNDRSRGFWRIQISAKIAEVRKIRSTSETPDLGGLTDLKRNR